MADYSFIANPAKPPNLLEAAGQYGQAIGLANQNRLFQQTLRAKQAIGRAVQSAIGPDGSYDPAKANQLIAASSDAAFGAPEALEQTTAQRAQQASIANTQASTAATNIAAAAAQFKLGQERRSAVTGALLPLVRNVAAGKPIEDDQINDAGKQLLSNPAFNDDQSRQLIAQEVVGLLAKPGAERSATILNHFIGANANPAGVQTAQGNLTPVDTGGQKQLLQAGGVAPPQVTASLTNTMSPETAGSLASIAGPGGTPEIVPRSALETPTGQPKPNVPGLTGAAGEVVAGLSPAAAAAASTAGQGNAGMAIQLQQRAGQVPTNKALLGNMEGLIDNFEPGPQSQWWKNLGQLAQEYHLPMPGAPPANKTAAQEEFGKMAFQLAQSQFQALGGTGTDSKLDSTMHTSPSDLLTRYGNKGIINILKGNEDAIHAQNEAWQKWESAGHGPDTYGKFQSQFNNIYDPRVFQSQYMTPGERQQMLKGMTKAEEQKFQQDWKLAHKLGWIE